MLKPLKEQTVLTVKMLKDKLNELDETFDNVPVYVNQCNSQGESIGIGAVSFCYCDDPNDELASFEIECPFEKQEKGLTAEMVFYAYLAEETGKHANMMNPLMGYINLNSDEQENVDQMIEDYNKSLTTA